MKISIIIVVIFAGFLFSGFLPMEDSLEDLRWKKNVIMIFPDPSKIEMAKTDTESLTLKMDPRELVYFVFSDSIVSNSGYNFTEEYILELETRYLLGSKSSCWVLLGKDGGLKIRREEDLDWDRIFSAVDSIPQNKGKGIWN